MCILFPVLLTQSKKRDIHRLKHHETQSDYVGNELKILMNTSEAHQPPRTTLTLANRRLQ